MRPTLFGMTSTAASQDYTLPALESFLRNTSMGPADRLVLIDNDGTFPESDSPCERLVPPSPRSYAGNVNALLDLADAAGQDLCFVSNDVHFTPGWWDGLAGASTGEEILLPSCNQTHVYRTSGGLQITPLIGKAATEGRLAEVDEVAASHVSRHADDPGATYRLMPFYVFLMPRAVYTKVGRMDTRFGVGGAEDVDYRLRAIRAGIQVRTTNRAWLLHYQGKSTWDGAESSQATNERNALYKREFQAKWGDDLTGLCLSWGSPDHLVERYGLSETLAAGDWHRILEVVMSGAPALNG